MQSNSVDVAAQTGYRRRIERNQLETSQKLCCNHLVKVDD